MAARRQGSPRLVWREDAQPPAGRSPRAAPAGPIGLGWSEVAGTPDLREEHGGGCPFRGANVSADRGRMSVRIGRACRPGRGGNADRPSCEIWAGGVGRAGAAGRVDGAGSADRPACGLRPDRAGHVIGPMGHIGPASHIGPAGTIGPASHVGRGCFAQPAGWARRADDANLAGRAGAAGSVVSLAPVRGGAVRGIRELRRRDQAVHTRCWQSTRAASPQRPPHAPVRRLVRNRFQAPVTRHSHATTVVDV